MLAVLFALAWACWSASSVLAITVSESSSSYTIDTQSDYGFVVDVDRDNCDITSLQFYGTEYQYSGTHSHIGSGLGTGTQVSYTQSGDYVVVQCTQVNDRFDLTHYLVFHDASNSIYLATDTNSEPSNGELRFIFRLVGGLTKTYPTYEYYGDVSDTAGGDIIEGSDVFTVDGETRSKFYSSNRFIDEDVYCATDDGASVHACFVRPDARATEKSSGGPFFRDISLNNGGDYHSVTYYMNSGHVQTEDYRQGFHGPYVFSFSRSGVPSAAGFDLSFFDDLDLGGGGGGYTAAGGRGTVSGTASGVSADLPAVVHWYNSDYQYWATADSGGGGAFTSPAMVAGDYSMVLYQGEYEAATASVSVAAGASTGADIAADAAAVTASRTTVFQLGDYDGTPTGFRNADEQLRMHPSDGRMADWSPGAVAATDTASLPMAIFAAVNNGQQVAFDLDAAAAAVDQDATLRIATTLSFAGGRPQASVNDFDCPQPPAPSKIDSRGVTRGAYSGYHEVYECSVPSGTLQAGSSNTVTINVISGSGGDDFLSPNVILDAIELFY